MDRYDISHRRAGQNGLNRHSMVSDITMGWISWRLDLLLWESTWSASLSCFGQTGKQLGHSQNSRRKKFRRDGWYVLGLLRGHQEELCAMGLDVKSAQTLRTARVTSWLFFQGKLYFTKFAHLHLISAHGGPTWFLLHQVFPPDHLPCPCTFPVCGWLPFHLAHGHFCQLQQLWSRL